MSQERLEAARAAHQRGDLPRALAGYEEILREQPEAADVWHLHALAEHQSGNLDGAQASIGRAMAIDGPRAGFLMLEGAICQDRGDLAGAEARFRAAAEARPGWAPAHVELGKLHLDQRRPQEALRDFQAAVEADPKHVRAWNNLGVALQSLGRMDEALRAFNHTTSLDPAYAVAHYNLARIYAQRGDAKLAIQHAQAAVRSRPGYVDAWLMLGDMLKRQRETGRALAAFNSALQVSPDNLGALFARAETIAEAGGYSEALQEFARLAQLAPTNVRMALGANLLLPLFYESAEQLERVRAQYAQGLERLHASADSFVLPSGFAALDEMRWTNFYLAYQGQNDRDLQRRYGEFHRRVLAPAVPEMFAPRARHSPRERLRVGFASHFFFNCTAGRYFSSWVTHLDRTRFETYTYYTNEWVADATREIAAASSVFRHLPGRPLGEIARQIVADDLDVLVYPELGMHPETFALAGLRLAPVQCAGWGHPNTTGLPEIDWFISCAEMEPSDANDHYTEKLALLPGLGTRYAVPKAKTGETRADFGVPDDATAYLLPQSIFKIHPDNDAILAEVLARDPRGVAVLFASHYSRTTQDFASRLGSALALRGVDIHERVIFLAPSLSHPRYLRLNELCDVMIDTLHWSGGNTSLDALATGLPVVTCPGRFMRGRQSQAMLRILGVPELIAATPQELVETLLRVGLDRAERQDLSARIVANLGALFEREEPIRALEEFLLEAARAA